MTVLKFADGKIGYVGSSWTSPGVFCVRVFGSKGLMHYEIDFGTWDTPDQLHQTSTLYIQRGKDGYGKREELTVPESDMFRAELDMFARKLPHRKIERAERAQRQCRARRGLCRPAFDRAAGPGGQDRRRHRRSAQEARGRKPQCCLAAISPT